jgi:[ribosomal protein S18]-alanine N-acetyltransferase
MMKKVRINDGSINGGSINGGVEIIPMEICHLDDIMIIEQLCFKIPWSRMSFEDEITRNNFAAYLCARTGDRVVGYAGMWQVCDEGHITNIAVHPDFRGMHIAGRLLAGLIGAASKCGIVRMTLEVRTGNKIAQALYKKYGFREQGIRKRYYSDDNEDALIMWKEILQPENIKGEQTHEE